MIVLCGFAGTQKNRSADTEYRGPGKLFCSSGDLITGGAEKLQGQRAKIRQKARENPGGKRKKNIGGLSYMLLKNTVVFIVFAPKNFLQKAEATEGAYSLQLKISIYAALVSLAK